MTKPWWDKNVANNPGFLIWSVYLDTLPRNSMLTVLTFFNHFVAIASESESEKILFISSKYGQLFWLFPLLLSCFKQSIMWIKACLDFVFRVWNLDTTRQIFLSSSCKLWLPEFITEILVKGRVEEQTSYFWSKDDHRDLHWLGVRLNPSFAKCVDISFQRAILPFTTWNLLRNSPRILMSFFTSSGLHLFRLTPFEGFGWELDLSEESSSLISVPSSSSSDVCCSSCGIKTLLPFTRLLIGEAGASNDFQNSSESSESRESLSP